MTQNNLDTKGDESYYRNFKIVFVITVFIVMYFWLFGEVNSSDKFEAKLDCGFMEQFVEIYDMDVICNKSFKDNKINRVEYWSITWKFKNIKEIWNENLKNGKGRPEFVANSKVPIPQRFFNVEDYMKMPGIDEIIEIKDEQKNRNSGNKRIDDGIDN